MLHNMDDLENIFFEKLSKQIIWLVSQRSINESNICNVRKVCIQIKQKW